MFCTEKKKKKKKFTIQKFYDNVGIIIKRGYFVYGKSFPYFFAKNNEFKNMFK